MRVCLVALLLAVAGPAWAHTGVPIPSAHGTAAIDGVNSIVSGQCPHEHQVLGARTGHAVRRDHTPQSQQGVGQTTFGNDPFGLDLVLAVVVSRADRGFGSDAFGVTVRITVRSFLWRRDPSIQWFAT